MIRHIVLFKLKPGRTWEDPLVQRAEGLARQVGEKVPELTSWQVGRNLSPRDIAYDFAVIGLVRDQPALDRYLQHPFHQEAVRSWQAVSDWVVADLSEPESGT